MEVKLSKSTIQGVITAPSSKSYAQRAIAAALLADGVTTLSEVELCSDTKAALGVIQLLGARVQKVDATTYRITGGLKPISDILNIGESGLATRMFTPIAALHKSPLTITGKGSILTRPMNMMYKTLRSLGVDLKSNENFLPITVCGAMKGGSAEVNGEVSSQFLTGLLMAVPMAKNDSTLKVAKLNSVPYIDMTLDVISKFGVVVKHDDYKEFHIKGSQKYKAIDYSVEGDWSGASCALIAGAVAGEITIENLNPLSIQADVAIIDALSKAGAQITTTNNSITVKKGELNGFEFDATHCPDLFPALAALAALCEGISKIKGTKRLVHKESNRALTIAQEFRKLGIRIDIVSEDDTMIIEGGEPKGGSASSRNDHRIAMALSVLSLCADGEVVIAGAEAINKSYPNYWKDLEKLKK